MGRLCGASVGKSYIYRKLPEVSAPPRLEIKTLIIVCTILLLNMLCHNSGRMPHVLAFNMLNLPIPQSFLASGKESGRPHTHVVKSHQP